MYTIKKVLQICSDEIKSLQNDYMFAGINEKNFIKMSRKAASSYSFANSVSYESIKRIVKQNLIEEIEINIINKISLKGYKKICNSYLMCMNKELHGVSFLDKFIEFLDKYKILLTDDDIVYLLKNSEDFKLAVSLCDNNEVSNEVIKKFISLYKQKFNIQDKVETKKNSKEQIIEVENLDEDLEEILKDESVKKTFLNNEELIEEYQTASVYRKKEIEETLYLVNKKLVIKIALKYVGSELDLEDLVQEGSIGLLKAIEMHDPAKGTKFSTYAVWWIRQSIARAVGNTGNVIRMPINIFEKSWTLKKATETFLKNYERMPDDDEIKEITGLTDNDLKNIRSANVGLTSLDATLKDDENDATMANFIPDSALNPEDQYIVNHTFDNMKEILKNVGLTKMESFVIAHRYGLAGNDILTLEHIGKLCGGFSRERIRQIESTAIFKIRSSKQIKNLADLTDNPDWSLQQIKAQRKNRNDFKKDIQITEEKTLTVYEIFHSYDKTKIDNVLAQISESYAEKLIILYGSDYSLPYKNEDISDEERSKLKEEVEGLILNALENYVEFLEVSDNKLKTCNELAYIYFPNYEKDLIDKAITIIDYVYPGEIEKIFKSNNYNKYYKQDMKMLKKRFEKVLGNLVKDIKYYDYVFITKKKTLNPMHKIKTIYEFFEEYDKKLIDKGSLILNKNYPGLLTEIYGPDLNVLYDNEDLIESDKSQKKNSIKAKMAIILSNLKGNPNYYEKLEVKVVKKPATKTKTFYGLFSSYEKDLVDKAIEIMNILYPGLILEIYGEDLNKAYKVRNLSNKEKSSKRSKIKYYVKQILDNLQNDINFYDYVFAGEKLPSKIDKKVKTIYESLAKYDENMINIAITILNKLEPGFITDGYGPDLDVPYDNLELTEKERVNKKVCTRKKIERIISNLEKYPDYYESVLSEGVSKVHRKSIYKTIYESFSDYEKDFFDKALNILEKISPGIVGDVYGPDLDAFYVNNNLSSKEIYSKKSNIRRRLQNILEKLTMDPNYYDFILEKNQGLCVSSRKIKTIYETYVEFDKTLVNKAIDTFNKQFTGSVLELYGPDLETSYINENFTSKERMAKKALFKSRFLKTLYEISCNVEKELVDENSNCNTDNLSLPRDIATNAQTTENNFQISPSAISYLEFDSLLFVVSSEIDLFEQNIVALTLKNPNRYIYSFEDAAKMLNTTPECVARTTQKVLNLIKGRFDSSIDEYIKNCEKVRERKDENEDN